MAPLTEVEKKERKIEENWPYCGVLLFRKKEGRKILSSGSIVKFQSPYVPDCEWCLVLSDRFHDRSGEISINDYYFELSKLDGTRTSKKVELIDIGKPKATRFYRPTPGLVIIPIYPPSTYSITNYSKLKSIFGYRTILSSCYYVNKGHDIDIRCYIAGSFERTEDSFTVEQFKLTVTKGSVQQYELQAAGSDSVYRSFSDIMKDWPHLHPHGAVIIGSFIDGMERLLHLAIGVLNFNEEEMIAPIFFTHETISCEDICFFHPLFGTIANPDDGRTKVDAIVKDMSTSGVKGKTSMQMRPQEELEDPEKWLNNAMNFYGLQILSELPKDGNCLFHAVADQLSKRLGQRDHTHKSLRELAVKELEQRHSSMGLGKVLQAENKDVKKYLQEMRGGSWGGDPELTALSFALQTTIKVVTPAENPEHAMRIINGNYKRPPILLGYCREHYCSLEPRESLINGKGSTVQSSSIEDSVKPSLHTDPSLRHPVVTGRDIKHKMSTSKSGTKGIETQYPANFPSTNDDSLDSMYSTVYTDDWRTEWEKGEGFARFLLAEYTKKVEELQRCQQEVSLVKEHNSQLRIDMKKIEKENEELRARNEETEELRRANKMLHTKLSKANSIIEVLMGSNDMDAAKPSGGSSISIEQRASDDSSEEEPFFDASNDVL